MAQGEPADAVWEANTMADDNGRRYDSAYAYLRPAMAGAPLLDLQCDLLDPGTAF